jgi:hypothetical protein
MRKLIVLIILLSFLFGLSTAFSGTLIANLSDKSNKDGGINIWKSDEAIMDCVKEIQETHQIRGPICLSGVAARVKGGTQVRLLGEAEWSYQIEVLDGPSKGIVGFVQKGFYRD